jgi:hypothetical protein
MIWCPPIFWWTLHASEHRASEGAQKFALTNKLAEASTGLKLVIERIEHTPLGGDCFENTEGVLQTFRGKP